MDTVVLGVDIGTSSTKGVLVDLSGRILDSTTRAHEVSRPAPGHVEMDGELWWEEFCSIAAELNARSPAPIAAVGVSGMGPCALLTDGERPTRPAILYGVDMRSGEQIARLNAELGAGEIAERCGSALTSQAVGPKLAWVADHEPEVFAASRRLFMPASWLAWHLTGEYVLDRHSASQCTPMFDTHTQTWYEPWCELIAPQLELPRLAWAGEEAGRTQSAIAGIPSGTPVIVGTIDAWSEAISVDAHNVGDLMLMYGTTMFLVNTVTDIVRTESMWSTVGALPGTRNLAGGMAASGAITGWLRTLVGAPDYEVLLAEAAASPPGARGLAVLPYFAGERTPIMDPDARGVIAGLTLSHTRGDLYRAVLEATAYGIRHNVAEMLSAGGQIDRVVAVGGGAQGGLWTQIVSDITGLTQVLPRHVIGASYGAGLLAAQLVGEADIASWNPPTQFVEPDRRLAERYDDGFRLYRELYESTKPIVHALARSGLDPG